MLRTLFLAPVILLACAPVTPVRRSALVPASSTPSRLGSPLEGGEIRVSGEANPAARFFGSSSVNSPQLGSPGLYVPETQLGGSVYGAPTRFIELGGQARYARLAWARPTAAGVLEIPQNPSLVLGGAGVRTNIPVRDSGFAVSVITELNLARISQAVFQCSNCDGFTTNPEYDLHRIEHETFVMPSLTLHFCYDFNDYVSIYGAVGAERGIRNVGFDRTENLDASTLSGFLMVPISAGVEARYAPFFAGLTWSYPVELVDDLDLGAALSLRAGLFF